MFTINQLRNEEGNWRSRLINQAYTMQTRQIQTQAHLRSSNYSATQNFTNFGDLTDEMVVGGITAGA